MNLFVTGIGTNVGKTIMSAVLTEALQADYWKPIQSGTIEGRDAETVKYLISNNITVIHPEAYSLKEPLSPHFAAKLEGIEIDLNKIHLPKTNNKLLIEGAGGLLVPINNQHYVIDIAKQFNCEIALVVSNYLGCINHTLLSIDYILKHNLRLSILILNGEFEPEVESAIINYAKLTTIIKVPTLKSLSKEEISKAALLVREQLGLKA